jgi:hypothetical protein
MKNVMYYYKGVQGEEELYEDEVVDKLAHGQVMERAGEYWRIIEVETLLVVSELTRAACRLQEGCRNVPSGSRK